MTWTTQPLQTSSRTTWDAEWLDGEIETFWDGSASGWGDTSATAGSWTPQAPAAGDWE